MSPSPSSGSAGRSSGQSTGTACSTKSSPSTSARRWRRAPVPPPSTARHCATSLPSCQMAKPTPGWASAWRRTASTQWASSVASVFRNLRRAGVAKNSSRTSTVVPTLRAVGCSSPLRPSSSQPWGSSVLSTRVSNDTSAIEQMAASASPRKPMVPTDSRSARLAILLVAWRLSAVGSSLRKMPQPLSSTLISRTPPACSRTVIWVAPASSALSSNSRTTEAGRSTTSPAAIWLMSSSGSSRMGRRGGVVMRGIVGLAPVTFAPTGCFGRCRPEPLQPHNW